MFASVYAAVIAALVFYAALPLAGAFIARRQWRAFRRAVMEATDLPELRFGAAGTGRARLTGRVDALGGDDELWVRSDSLTAVARLGGAVVYTLSGAPGSGDEVGRLRWQSVRSVAPGTRAMVAGHASQSGGRTVIGSRDDRPLVVLYDGDDGSMPERAIRSGRHPNEYWNPLTQVSLALGVLAMSAIISLALASGVPAMAAAIVFTAAFSPVLPLLPPGLAFFLAYRHYWRRGLEYRARRDLATLRREPGSRRAWKAKARISVGLALSFFSLALAVNAWLALAAFRSLL